jgi:hypothetical protein
VALQISLRRQGARPHLWRPSGGLLSEARERRDEARKLLKLGLDPIGEREVARALRGSTFKTVAEEWLTSRAEQYAPVTMSKALWILETFIYPSIGE